MASGQKPDLGAILGAFCSGVGLPKLMENWKKTFEEISFAPRSKFQNFEIKIFAPRLRRGHTAVCTTVLHM